MTAEEDITETERGLTEGKANADVKRRDIKADTIIDAIVYVCRVSRELLGLTCFKRVEFIASSQLHSQVFVLGSS